MVFCAEYIWICGEGELRSNMDPYLVTAKIFETTCLNK